MPDLFSSVIFPLFQDLKVFWIKLTLLLPALSVSLCLLVSDNCERCVDSPRSVAIGRAVCHGRRSHPPNDIAVSRQQSVHLHYPYPRHMTQEATPTTTPTSTSSTYATSATWWLMNLVTPGTSQLLFATSWQPRSHTKMWHSLTVMECWLWVTKMTIGWYWPPPSMLP